MHYSNNIIFVIDEDGVQAKKQKLPGYKERYEILKVENERLVHQNRILKFDLVYKLNAVSMDLNRCILDLNNIREIVQVDNINTCE